MKNLILLLLLSTSSYCIIAQNKPSKEVTIAFIQRTLQLTEGKQGPQGVIYNSFHFTGDSSTYYELDSDGNSNWYYKYSLIRWEHLKDVYFTKSTDKNGITTVYVAFNVNSKQLTGCGTKCVDKIKFTETVIFYVTSEKLESFKKACLRLSEIAKEETKDPFQE